MNHSRLLITLEMMILRLNLLKRYSHASFVQLLNPVVML